MKCIKKSGNILKMEINTRYIFICTWKFNCAIKSAKVC